MAKLFVRTGSVTHIPTEKDVDPELLESTPGQQPTDYRDSNKNEATSIGGNPGGGVAHTSADKTFLTQHTPDGSYQIEEVDEQHAHDLATGVTKAPDANKGKVVKAPDAEAARGALYKDLEAEGVEPASKMRGWAPTTASYVVKVGSMYLKTDRISMVLTAHQQDATKFPRQGAARIYADSLELDRVKRAWDLDSLEPRVVAMSRQ